MAAISAHALVATLARLHPALWEIFGPRGPQPVLHIGHRGRSFDEVLLNPQPLPPRELIALSVSETVRAVAEAAIAARAAGGDARGILREVGDDWCPTPPRPLPWPRRWPAPWPLAERYPEEVEREGLGAAAQAYASVLFGAYAARVADEELGAFFGELSERLVESALAPREG